MMIWKMAPKKSFSGHRSLRMAVAIATISFNEGMQAVPAILTQIGLNVGTTTKEFNCKYDKLREKHRRIKGQPSLDDSERSCSPLEQNSDIEDELEYGAGIGD